MAQLTAKRSTIFIADGSGIKVFHSVSEVPAPLRRKLHESTRSSNSATILIADRQGREELVRALQGEPSNVQCRLAETLRARQTRPPQENPATVRRKFAAALDRFTVCTVDLCFRLALAGIAFLVRSSPKVDRETRRLVSRELLPHRLPTLSYHPDCFCLRLLPPTMVSLAFSWRCKESA